MDQQIDQLIQLSGNKHRYQYCFLCLSFFLWINTCFNGNVVPLLEKPPLITYINSDNITMTHPLTYDICDKYNFTILSPPHSSLVLDFGIYCDRTKTGLIGSFTVSGYAIGALLFPVITSYMTHKPIILYSVIIFALLAFLTTILKAYYWIIMFLLVLMGIFSNFSSYSSLVAVEEIISSEKRVLFGNIVNIGFSFSGIVFISLFYYFDNWIYIYYSVICFILLIGFFFLLFSFDSPRGFMTRKNITKTLEILRNIAKFNNRLEEFDKGIKQPKYIEALNAIQDSNEKNNILTQEDGEKKGLKKKLIAINHSSLSSSSSANKNGISSIGLIKYPSIRNKFFALCLLFFCTNGIYYGIAIGAKSLPGNFYFNILILYFIEAASFFIVGVLSDIPSIGRKKTLLSLYICGILCMLSLVFINISNTFQLILFLISRFCVAGSITTFYSYSLENYPTPLRTLGFGINTTCGNLGGALVPIIIEHVDQKILLFCYAAVMVTDCLVLMLFLKETVGLPMPETIEELNDMKKEEKY